jgi:hypothetical protein
MASNSAGQNGNWFAVSRLLFDHYLVGAGQPMKPANPKKGAYSKMEAWLDLIAMAAYEPSTILNKGREQKLETGQAMAGYSFLAERWNWSVDTVRWFVKQLEIALMITRHCNKQRANRYTNQIQILSISNYGNYQASKGDEHQANYQPTQQASTNPTPSAPHESNNKQITREKEAGAVVVNCSAIHGPGFTLDFGAIDIAASLVGMSKERARSIAEICARDWVANNKQPQIPMAAVKAAILSDHNSGQVREVRLEKAKRDDHAERRKRMREYIEGKSTEERKV